jgi:SAM-dependent methyltransferase
MSGLLVMLRKIYRLVVPLSIRSSSFVQNLKPYSLRHNVIYDEKFYDSGVEGPAALSAGAISESIFYDLEPKSIIDVGCGTGALLEALNGKGCKVFGLEYSSIGLDYCRSRGLDVLKFNLEKDVLKSKLTFDVAISMEVAEHLPEKVADRYIDLLTSLADTIIFTAAPPGQGGNHHINLQFPSYWISKFQDRCFEYDQTMSTRWRDDWKASGSVRSWYHNNLMIFRNNQKV